MNTSVERTCEETTQFN